MLEFLLLQLRLNRILADCIFNEGSVRRIMMISIGYRRFIASDHVVEILKAADIRAARVTHTAAESGMLINASGGKKIRSIIKLKSKYIALSALKNETLKSRLRNLIPPSAPKNNDILSRKQKNGKFPHKGKIR